jgi:hypothetical protein
MAQMFGFKLAAAVVFTSSLVIAQAATPELGHAVGYFDQRLKRVVIVGEAGEPVDGARDRVWSWSGSRWEPESVPGPPGRTNAGAAYARSRGLAVVTGGARKTGERWGTFGDAWIGDARGWQGIADISPRDHHTLVETRDGGVLMFGGIPANRSAAWPSETFELREDAWVRVATEGPSGRGRSAMALDRKRNEIVLFGGVGAAPAGSRDQPFFGDTWIWNGSAWRKAAETGPRGRYAHGMAYDERRGVVLMYSGAAAHKDAPLADMWQWDGQRWSEIALSGPTPGYRYQPVMVYDSARDRTVLVGGLGGPSDTWEWDGARWRQIQ